MPTEAPVSGTQRLINADFLTFELPGGWKNHGPQHRADGLDERRHQFLHGSIGCQAGTLAYADQAG